jgi:chromosome segregation ATPase
MVVRCPSADIKCPWTGQRNQVDQHLIDCRFEPMRPIITQFIVDNQQLKDQVNQQKIVITSRENTMEKLLSLQKQLLSQVEQQEKENQQLKDQVNRLTIYIGEQQNVILRCQQEADEQRTQLGRHQNEAKQFNGQVGQLSTGR